VLSTIVAMHPNTQIEVQRSMGLKKTSINNLFVIRTNEYPEKLGSFLFGLRKNTPSNGSRPGICTKSQDEIYGFNKFCLICGL